MEQDNMCGWCGKTKALIPAKQGNAIHTNCINCGSSGPTLSMDDIRVDYLETHKQLNYILFTGIQCYAFGGAYDMKGFYNTLQDAIDKATELLEKDEDEWWHVYNIESSEIVAESDKRAVV